MRKEKSPVGADEKKWITMTEAVEKLSDGKGYPMIIYKDGQQMYLRTPSVSYRILSASLKVESIDEPKVAFTMSFP